MLIAFNAVLQARFCCLRSTHTHLRVMFVTLLLLLWDYQTVQGWKTFKIVQVKFLGELSGRVVSKK